jgi:hypothetical protein
MDSLTRGSGIAVSMLVAATASVLLLLPGHPRAGSLRDPGPSGGAMMASAVVTSSLDTPRPGGGTRPPARPFRTGRRPDHSRYAGPQAATPPGPTEARPTRACGTRDAGLSSPAPGPAVRPGRPVTRRLRDGYRDTTESAQTCPDEF